MEWWSGGKEQGLEKGSNGVLGLKAEIDLIFTFLPLNKQEPNMIHFFSIYQPFITPPLHHSITPIL